MSAFGLCLDFVIVFMALVDLISEFVSLQSPAPKISLLRLARIARLARLARLVRLVRVFKELALMVNAGFRISKDDRLHLDPLNINKKTWGE